MKTPTRKNEAIWIEERKHWRLDIQVNGKRKSFYSAQKAAKVELSVNKRRMSGSKIRYQF